MVDYNELSLINIAERILKEKQEPWDLYELFDAVVEKKDIELEDSAKTLNEFYAELSASAKFIYAGANRWDLKINQPLDQWDKDGSDYNEYSEVHDEEMDKRIEAQREEERKHQAMLEERQRIAEEKAEQARLLDEQAKDDGDLSESEAIADDLEDSIAEEFEEEGLVEKEDIVPEDEYKEDVDILETSEEEMDEEAEEDDKYLEYLDDYEDEYDK